MDKENHDTISNLNFWKVVKNNEIIDKKQKSIWEILLDYKQQSNKRLYSYLL
jgi:hypothetical protein